VIANRFALDNCNCTALRRASRAVSQFYDKALAPTGLRVTQFVILRYVNSTEGLSVNELASLLDLDRTTTGKNLQPLEKAGLITVAKSTSDRRASRIDLTQGGHEVLQNASILWRNAQTEFERLNGTEHSAALRSSLNAIKVDAPA
jgi:DNA-binding MarR family transcriptional regulator